MAKGDHNNEFKVTKSLLWLFVDTYNDNVTLYLCALGNDVNHQSPMGYYEILGDVRVQIRYNGGKIRFSFASVVAFREATGSRPSVRDGVNPDIRLQTTTCATLA